VKEVAVVVVVRLEEEKHSREALALGLRLDA
jgi:hypothetical protein